MDPVTPFSAPFSSASGRQSHDITLRVASNNSIQFNPPAQYDFTLLLILILQLPTAFLNPSLESNDRPAQDVSRYKGTVH